MIARSDQGFATEQEQLSHELQSQKDQNRIERETAIAQSSQALQGMERLRLILDAVAEGGVQAIHQSAGELRSFDAIHRALIEIQGIQASLAGVAGGTAPALTPGTNGRAIDRCPFRRRSPTDRSPGFSAGVDRRGGFPAPAHPGRESADQRRILASVLHLVAEAGLGDGG